MLSEAIIHFYTIIQNCMNNCIIDRQFFTDFLKNYKYDNTLDYYEQFLCLIGMKYIEMQMAVQDGVFVGGDKFRKSEDVKLTDSDMVASMNADIFQQKLKLARETIVDVPKDLFEEEITLKINKNASIPDDDVKIIKRKSFLVDKEIMRRVFYAMSSFVHKYYNLQEPQCCTTRYVEGKFDKIEAKIVMLYDAVKNENGKITIKKSMELPIIDILPPQNEMEKFFLDYSEKHVKNNDLCRLANNKKTGEFEIEIEEFSTLNDKDIMEIFKYNLTRCTNKN